MNKDIDINILRIEMKNYIKNAEKYGSEGMLSNGCFELKCAIAKAEEIFHFTNSLDDKNMLLEVYMKIAKFYFRIYTTTCNKKDILPSCMYYEKIIYFHEEELKSSSIHVKECLKQIMEAYVQLIWICLEVKDYQSFERFINKANKYALKLLKKTKVYEDEQYYILINVFKGDYFKAIKKYRYAYLYYYIAMKKIKKIYSKIHDVGILNDLILIYNDLSEVAKLLKRNNDKIKWDNNVNKLQKESEMFTNDK